MSGKLIYIYITFPFLVFVPHTTDQHLPRPQAVRGVWGPEVCFLVKLPWLYTL